MDETGIINQANPAAELLFGINTDHLLGYSLNKFLPSLSPNPNSWENCSEQILETSQNSRILEATISQH